MAVDAISEFLIKHDMLVYIVVFGKSSFQISEKFFTDIASYIDDKYVETHFEFNRTGEILMAKASSREKRIFFPENSKDPFKPVRQFQQ